MKVLLTDEVEIGEKVVYISRSYALAIIVDAFRYYKLWKSVDAEQRERKPRIA